MQPVLSELETVLIIYFNVASACDQYKLKKPFDLQTAVKTVIGQAHIITGKYVC